MNQCYRLGIDIGSTTVKVAVIDDNNKILFADYERHYANIQETLASLLKKCKGELGELSLRPILQVPADSLCRVTYIFHLSRKS